MGSFKSLAGSVSLSFRACPTTEGQEGTALKTMRERAEERRQSKLEGIRRQVKSGRLVVRQMTPEELAQHPPAEPRVKASRW